MTEEIESHETSTYMVEAAPSEVDARADIALKVEVSCPEARDLGGSMVRIVVQDGTRAKEVELSEFDGTVNHTDEFAVEAPIKPGEYTWIAVFPAQEKEGVLHKESSTPFSFTVKPHSTSIAVWGVPSPIALGDEFTIKVGVKCSAECKLTDKEIAVYGQKGKKVATGALGGVPWPGTSALYWAEMELEAPGVEGYHKWTVKFRKPDLELPHQDASYHFGFVTARQPEHVVTIEVISKATKTPIKNASVLLRPHIYRGYAYSSRTDSGGVAKLEVPKGKYKLDASKSDEYETFQTTVEITDDATVKAELVSVHDPNR